MSRKRMLATTVLTIVGVAGLTVGLIRGIYLLPIRQSGVRLAILSAIVVIVTVTVGMGMSLVTKPIRAIGAVMVRSIFAGGTDRIVLLRLGGETQASGHESDRLQPEEAEVINSDELLRAEWATVNDGIQTIYKILGPPPLKTLSRGSR